MTTAFAKKRKAAFLDRDGVINVDHGYVSSAEQFEFIDGVFDACRHLQQQGYLLIVVTNQSGIGRGYYTEQQFHSLTRWMNAQFALKGVHINEVFFCPHHPVNAKPPYQTECNCRKPAPGMLLQAIEKYQIDPVQSLMLGDKKADMQAAKAAGIRRKVLVLSGQRLTEEDKASADEVWPSIKTALTAV
ncbi:D-glycero-beta-D-manno-heptose 1,7-bisphosphate 7-phosphatase [Rheinheimera nanhaiensis]|uniref:D,D-heptose 1,7-bisphosphate phosphatase n=1 Tax=Rheinheimera nanhaiensis E407-8 TaxID=562729 RepID=I1DUD6_9GAMM|nr:D-glycero-beta-D-manno-heptose 1,7-bisphosphate 7-phosphatase [Rheinheimera nanhaiensis]GAB57664.1 D-glycero-D-manno-heptose 1,7-bisphosphate phosphatase [Rheinheimera nanhaiensis E407-8]